MALRIASGSNKLGDGDNQLCWHLRLLGTTSTERAIRRHEWHRGSCTAWGPYAMVDCPSIVVGTLSRLKTEYSEARRWREPEMEASIPGSYFGGDTWRNHGSINGGASTELPPCPYLPGGSSGPPGVRLTSQGILCGCSWQQSVISRPWIKRAARPGCRRCSTSVRPLQALEEVDSAVPTLN